MKNKQWDAFEKAAEVAKKAGVSPLELASALDELNKILEVNSIFHNPKTGPEFIIRDILKSINA